MAESPLDLLIAWLDAARREDREGMTGLLAPDAAWRGLRPEWVCASPEEIVDTWLSRARDQADLEAAVLLPGPDRAVLQLTSPSLRALDPKLLRGVYIAFHVRDGRISHLADHAERSQALPVEVDRVPSGVPESRDGGPGWFVLNVADADWVDGRFGAYTRFHGDANPFEHIGINIGVLQPGQPASLYHREGEQEDFLVLQGQCLLLIEGEERRLTAWDFVHCPPWTNHVFVGSGSEPCTLLALGQRTRTGVVYPVDPLAQRHGAAAASETAVPSEAYAGTPDDAPVEFDRSWLPGSG